MYRSETTPGSFAARVTWALVASVLFITGFLVGYFFPFFFLEIFGVQVGFYGIAAFTKVGVDITRASLNGRRVNKRRARTKRKLEKGKWNWRIVGFQKVGRRENPASLYRGFIGDRDQTYPYQKYLYVSDGNRVNRNYIKSARPDDPIGYKLLQAFIQPLTLQSKTQRVLISSQLISRGFLNILMGLIRILFLLLAPLRLLSSLLKRRPVPMSQRIFDPIPRPLPFNFEPPAEGDDSYQAELFLRAFGSDNCEIIWVDFVVSEGFRNRRQAVKLIQLQERIRASTAKYIMILQPARGKREAMFTASQVLIDLGMEWILFSDSDTILEPNAMEELVYQTYTTRTEREVGAVTGDVRIFNVENWLSFQSSLRYRFAFDPERASLSFGGYVTCVSGPLGLYRTKALKQILVRWINQTFLGKATTYGDDRSLTNLVLSLGYAVHFTQHARCWTDTPTNLFIWMRQQTRWNKSYYREFLLNLRSLWLFGPYLTLELFYQVLFPVFLFFSIVNLVGAALRTGHWYYAAIWLLTIMIGSYLRALYAIIREWNSLPDPQGRSKWKYLRFYEYGLLNILFLLPIKVYALATVGSTGWGTRERVDIKYRGHSSLDA